MEVKVLEDEKIILDAFNDLIGHCEKCKKPGELEMIERAFHLANDAHKGMRRKSGEPYIVHPISVAKIVATEIGLGAKSIASALMHDVVEDTEYSIDDIRMQFGEKIATIVDGLTKISGVFDNKASLQAENFRKMLLTLSEDVRVILIKIADRLHNMRTLHAMPESKRVTISAETIYLFAPLAHRLGLYAIKTELEDLSLKYRHPQIYNDILDKINENEKRRQLFINKFSLPIIEKLDTHKIQFEINGRPKSIYSIWNKMKKKNIPFEEVYDLLAIRIIFEASGDIPEKTQCWNIYSLITDIYMPKPDRIRDWVSTPKTNGYEALHATVMGPNGRWVEVQIRSRRMDEIAERGFAAHWKYKNNTTHETEIDKWLKNIRELLENPYSNALEFLDEFKMNLFASEIFVFTPKGEIITMPQSATCLDFAYEIHSEIGNKAIGAKVNHKLVGLSHKLNSGDQVEILSSERQRPQREWMDFVTTAKAKSSIKQALKSETKNRIEKGKKILEEQLGIIGLRPSSRVFRKLLPAYEVVSKDELYSKIGSGIILLDDLKKVLKKNTRNKLIRYWELQFSGKGKAEDIKKENFDKLNKYETFTIHENPDITEPDYAISKCCNPIPGDDVIGYKNLETEQVEIHKNNCSNAIRLMTRQANSIVSVNWTTHQILSFLVKIKINGIEKFGIYNEITTVITKDLSTNIRNINLSSHDGIFEGTIDLYTHNTKDLNNMIMNLSKIKGVDSVSRVELLDE
jgi:GTP diphosphokinase / guanosine-3',5'-bis(diphosphate) 3'-diphosphatase